MRWRQAEVDANVESLMFCTRLCGFHHVICLKIRRGTGPSFFQLYTSLVAYGAAQVKARILELRPRNGEPVWTLTVCHERHNPINQQPTKQDTSAAMQDFVRRPRSRLVDKGYGSALAATW